MGSSLGFPPRPPTNTGTSGPCESVAYRNISAAPNMALVLHVGLHETCITLPPGGFPKTWHYLKEFNANGEASKQDTRASFLANTECRGKGQWAEKWNRRLRRDG